MFQAWIHSQRSLEHLFCHNWSLLAFVLAKEGGYRELEVVTCMGGGLPRDSSLPAIIGGQAGEHAIDVCLLSDYFHCIP